LPLQCNVHSRAWLESDLCRHCGWIRQLEAGSDITDMAHGDLRTASAEENVERVREYFERVVLHDVSYLNL